jgi:hypothetical protein
MRERLASFTNAAEISGYPCDKGMKLGLQLKPYTSIVIE